MCSIIVLTSIPHRLLSTDVTFPSFLYPPHYHLETNYLIVYVCMYDKYTYLTQ